MTTTRFNPRTWNIVLISFALVISFTLLIALLLLASGPGRGPGTTDFLNAMDFNGSYDASPKTPIAYGGQSTYEGRIVFANLPVAVVKQVLPPELELASRKTAQLPGVHPIVLMYGYQTQTKWLLPWPVPTFIDYKELILLIPFVQGVGGTGKWHNYVVRMYLDNNLAIYLGNTYYGYYKEGAGFVDPGTATPLKVQQYGLDMFAWSLTVSGAPIPHPQALGTVENYQDALEIIGMPILGTMENFGDAHTCSFWDWDMQDVTVRHLDVTFGFLSPFRSSGMDQWVALGMLNSGSNSAFEILHVRWRLAFPSGGCDF